MYVYNYRLFERLHRRVASLAVLGVERANWRPDRFRYAVGGCEVGIRFPLAKLVDYRSRWAELEGSRNPFAVAVMAHLKTRETRHDDQERRRWKLALVRGLYERGFRRQEVLDWFRFVDWLMRLPAEGEAGFWEGLGLLPEIRGVPDVDTLQAIHTRLKAAQSVDEIRRLCRGESGD
ncbi:MAG: cytosolic protein, partial [Chloroflexi bacterium]|nr:cytosolic protein [Chloroflexota bacterium]